jgi:hypothetical protein
VTHEEAEAALQAWATVQRDELVQAAHQAGVSKNRIHVLTGIARTTIDRILEAPMGATQQRVSDYLDSFTAQWPRYAQSYGYGWGWNMQPSMASQHTASEIAKALLADAEFRVLKLGTWLNTPDGELLAAAVTALAPPPYQEDAQLLIEALQLAAQQQQADARAKLFVAGALVAAIAYGASHA